MKLFIFVGMTGTGKSYLIKKLFPAHNTVVYDVQDEYGEYESFFDEDIETAIDTANEMRGVNIVFEEFSIFLNNRSSLPRNLKKILIGKRHRPVTPVCVFHQLAQIPSELLGMTDYLVLFKTNDAPDVVKRKYREWPKIFAAYKKLQTAKKYSYVLIKR